MLGRLIILLTVVPLVELTLLLEIADRIEWGPTVGLVLGTGVLGAYLARREGVKVVQRIQRDMEAGIAPTSAVVDGALILVAGVVLVTPGILTDCFGFALLVPPIRALLKKRLTSWFRAHVVTIQPGDVGASSPGGGPFDDPFVDVDATSSDAEEKKRIE